MRDYIDNNKEYLLVMIDEVDAAALDDFPAIFYKLWKPQKIAFQSFFEIGKVPKENKEGIVCPMAKRGSR